MSAAFNSIASYLGACAVATVCNQWVAVHLCEQSFGFPNSCIIESIRTSAPCQMSHLQIDYTRILHVDRGNARFCHSVNFFALCTRFFVIDLLPAQALSVPKITFPGNWHLHMPGIT